MKDQVTPELLKNIYPLNQLSDKALDQLKPFMRVRGYAEGRTLFTVGDSPDDYFYVLEGSVWLIDQSEEGFQTVGPATAGDAFPLPYMVPSMHRARIDAESKLLLVDRKKLLDVVQKHQPASAQAMEMSYQSEGAPTSPSGAESVQPTAHSPQSAQSPVDWQVAFLRAPGFLRVAPNDLKRAFDLMHPVTFSAGDVVIEQGTPADYFYVIAEGRVEVLRGFAKADKAVRVAEYGPGATLGEDALISGNLRNATVRMLTHGKLMRLEGDDFRFLLKRALVRGVEASDARGMVERGSRWLDVRMPDERKVGVLPHSIVIPHPVVRGRLFTADPQISYVVVCAKGFDSPVIAFTLCKYGFDAYYLKGGFPAVAELAKAEVRAASL